MTIHSKKTHAVRNRAYWNWEYLRRNPLYLEFDEVISDYSRYLAKIGELSTYYRLRDEEPGMKGSKHCLPFYIHLNKKYGKEEAELYYKHFMHIQDFFRIFRTPVIPAKWGTLPVDTLIELLDGNDISFEVTSSIKILTLVTLHKDWTINVNNNNPSFYQFKKLLSRNITINTDSMLKNDKDIKITQEKNYAQHVESVMDHYNNDNTQQFTELIESIHKLDSLGGTVSDELAQDIVQIGSSFLEGPQIPDEDYDKMYDFLLQGKYIHGADEMRLASLVIWDFVNYAGKSFNEALKWLQGTVKSYDISSEWDQVFKNSLMKKYYTTTDECITRGQILPLG